MPVVSVNMEGCIDPDIQRLIADTALADNAEDMAAIAAWDEDVDQWDEALMRLTWRGLEAAERGG
jgi:hypothetical protein